MSKYDAVKALAKQCAANELYDAQRALDEYAAHLAHQSEGVSDELPDDIRVPLDEVRADLGYLFGRVAADGSFMQAAVDSVRLKLDKVSAALQSVRPPVGVVSDDYKEIARLIGSIFFSGDFKAETYNERELEKLLRKTGNFYDTQEQFDDASRHAPTKD